MYIISILNFQNENGPCPLIAIMNLLIMKGRVTLPSLVDIVTTEKLMEYLGDCILDSIPKVIFIVLFE